MKIWLSLPFLPADQLTVVVDAAERADVDGIAVADHVGVPAQLESEYPYTGTRAVLPVETELPDPLVLVSALAARTSRLRFMTHVLIGPLRHPILLAKGVATVAALADGRFDLGVGVGWMREEFDALGVPFERRGGIMDEMIPLMRDLWTGKPVEHHGRQFHFEAFALNPRPASPVPILVGGYSAAAVNRAARLADGWVGVNPTVAQLESLVEQLHDARRAAGTDQQPFQIRTGVKGRLEADTLQTMTKLGVDALVVSPWQLVPRGTAQSATSIAENIPHVVAQVHGDL